MTAAEGIVAVASHDTHEVIVIDKDSGQEKWRRFVDGRIDSPPTIYQGAVYVGTRGGWVYALNRDSGELIWKFYAAPTTELIMAHGQSENAQPTMGTVAVVDGLIWTNSGRYVELDRGVAWYALDPKTGEVKKSGEITPTDEEGWGRTTGQNTPWVSDGEHIILHRAGLKVASGKMAQPNIDFQVGMASVRLYPQRQITASHQQLLNPAPRRRTVGKLTG